MPYLTCLDLRYITILHLILIISQWMTPKLVGILIDRSTKFFKYKFRFKRNQITRGTYFLMATSSNTSINTSVISNDIVNNLTVDMKNNLNIESAIEPVVYLYKHMVLEKEKEDFTLCMLGRICCPVTISTSRVRNLVRDFWPMFKEVSIKKFGARVMFISIDFDPKLIL